MSNPTFSIIMTVLNGINTIETCLDSIVNQSFNDFELIVVDGGSTDGTLSVLEKYNQVITKIIIPGIGLYAGLNVGIDTSTGQWLFFIGCDDRLFNSDTLMKMSKFTQYNSNGVISGSVQYTGGYVMTPRFGSPYFMQYRLHHQGTFYHRSIFNELRYSEELSISADYELNTRLALADTPHCEAKLLVSLYSEKGISSIQYRKNFMEVRLVNRRLFKGLSYFWVTAYCWVQQSIWLIRNSMGLLNLKFRLKNLLKFNAYLMLLFVL